MCCAISLKDVGNEDLQQPQWSSLESIIITIGKTCAVTMPKLAAGPAYDEWLKNNEVHDCMSMGEMTLTGLR